MPPQNVYFAAHSYKYTFIWIEDVFRPTIVQRLHAQTWLNGLENLSWKLQRGEGNQDFIKTLHGLLLMFLSWICHTFFCLLDMFYRPYVAYVRQLWYCDHTRNNPFSFVLGWVESTKKFVCNVNVFRSLGVISSSKNTIYGDSCFGRLSPEPIWGVRCSAHTSWSPVSSTNLVTLVQASHASMQIFSLSV
jgi:hypothetical protein